MAELRKSHSNYTLTRKRQLTSKGAIYERDWMTVSELDGFAPGTMPVYASGNFKMTINNDRGGKKKYSFSNWVLNNDGDAEWNILDINEEDFKIKNELVKPNYSSILDFAYYGSAVELVKGTVNDLISWYPGELYVTNRHLVYYDSASGFVVTDEYIVENPFGIDVSSSYVNKDRVDNQLRYMYLSWDKYEVIDGSGNTVDIVGWTPGLTRTVECYDNGDILFTGATIYIDNGCEQTTSSELCPDRDRPFDGTEPGSTRPKGYMVDENTIVIPMGIDSLHYCPKYQVVRREDCNDYNGDIRNSVELTELDPKPIDITSCDNIEISAVYANGKVYMVSNAKGWHIRLKKKYIDEAFDNFDDFEKTLLNRDTKPMYKAKLYTPRETDRGVVTHEVAYIWPLLSGGWNLDFESQTYESYIDGLLYIANYYDEIRTDNIWRSYTHESIKNFDWTTPRDTYVPEMDGMLIDTERMNAILHVCGRQFDDLKRYIENIKFTTNISYDSKNNMPDIAMAKFLEMAGWDVKNVAPSHDNSLIHVEEYPGKDVKYTPEDANKEFLKRMILNSRNILSKKGTRAGIEAMYSMFGIFDLRHGYQINGKTAGFTIDEYDALVENYISGDDFIRTINMNIQKSTYNKQFERTGSDTCGLFADYKFDIDGVQYLVPWYDLYSEYDGYPYYQMMGGWGKRQWKKVSFELAPNIHEIFSDSELAIYDETVKNVKVIETFEELNKTPIGYLNEGDIYYVLNLTRPNCSYSEYNTHYVFFTGSTTDFAGETVDYSDSHKWCIVDSREFESASDLTWYAKKIIYIESLHDSSIGNNPHNGNGNYDGGKEYFEYYNQLFKGSLDNDLFDEYRARVDAENAKRHYDNRFRTEKKPDLQDETDLLTGIGFNVGELVKDNDKIWYFLDYENEMYQWPANFSGITLERREFNWLKPNGNTDQFKRLQENGSGKLEELSLKYEAKEYQNKPIAFLGDEHQIHRAETKLNIPGNIKNYMDEPHEADWTTSYSVINTKIIKISYKLPWDFEDYVKDVVEFYVKQLIPSTTIIEFVFDGNDWGERPVARSPYARLSLSPTYQSIRSWEDGADISINSENINPETISITSETTE